MTAQLASLPDLNLPQTWPQVLGADLNCSESEGRRIGLPGAQGKTFLPARGEVPGRPRGADDRKISVTRRNWRRVVTAISTKLLLSHILDQSLQLAHQISDELQKRTPGFLPDDVRELAQLTITDGVSGARSVRKKYRAPLLGFCRFARSSRHSFIPQTIDFVDDLYPIVACARRSRRAMLIQMFGCSPAEVGH
jgi:hypothetical protein